MARRGQLELKLTATREIPPRWRGRNPPVTSIGPDCVANVSCSMARASRDAGKTVTQNKEATDAAHQAILAGVEAFIAGEDGVTDEALRSHAAVRVAAVAVPSRIRWRCAWAHR